MYYKVDNKESDSYKKLHELRTKELEMEDNNVKAIEEKTGLKWGKYLGYQGQQSFNRVTEYSAFAFIAPKKVDLKVWREHKEHTGVYEPNRRTKLGREMAEFLNNGLEGWYFMSLLEAMGIEDSPTGKYQLPYLEIEKKAIVMCLDDSTRPTDKNIVEITSKEFAELQK